MHNPMNETLIAIGLPTAIGLVGGAGVGAQIGKEITPWLGIAGGGLGFVVGLTFAL